MSAPAGTLPFVHSECVDFASNVQFGFSTPFDEQVRLVTLKSLTATAIDPYATLYESIYAAIGSKWSGLSEGDATYHVHLMSRLAAGEAQCSRALSRNGAKLNWTNAGASDAVTRPRPKQRSVHAEILAVWAYRFDPETSAFLKWSLDQLVEGNLSEEGGALDSGSLSFLLEFLSKREHRPTALMATDAGNFAAIWQPSADQRLTLEFLPDSRIKWIFVGAKREGARRQMGAGTIGSEGIEGILRGYEAL